jgi:hypothetical protein
MDRVENTITVVMKAILQEWNIMRILRLVFGLAILIQGVVARDPLTITLGLLLGGMAVANLGCCGTNGCAINTPDIKKTQPGDYEELDIKK